MVFSSLSILTKEGEYYEEDERTEINALHFLHSPKIESYIFSIGVTYDYWSYDTRWSRIKIRVEKKGKNHASHHQIVGRGTVRGGRMEKGSHWIDYWLTKKLLMMSNKITTCFGLLFIPWFTLIPLSLSPLQSLESSARFPKELTDQSQICAPGQMEETHVLFHNLPPRKDDATKNEIFFISIKILQWESIWEESEMTMIQSCCMQPRCPYLIFLSYSPWIKPFSRKFAMRIRIL